MDIFHSRGVFAQSSSCVSQPMPHWAMAGAPRALDVDAEDDGLACGT
ncbi:MAG: hypothetical protein IT440_09800 [Phycisphaeraceae bacterium]|nr:hypothetical protein [Phycisphaeraceae bacterium]